MNDDILRARLEELDAAAPHEQPALYEDIHQRIESELDVLRRGLPSSEGHAPKGA